MRKIYVIIAQGSSGGTATLSIRISQKLINKNQEVVYICEEISDINSAMELKKIGVTLLEIEKNQISIELFDLYGFDAEYVFLSYTLDEYLFAEKLKRKLNIKQNILYIVHKYELTKGKRFNRFLNYIIKKIYKPVIKNIVENGDVFYMDAEYINELNDFYNFKSKNFCSQVLNLPMHVREIDLENIRDKSKRRTFNLLAIARAEFPFKGYIIGLIDDFLEILKKHPSTTLKIISFGRDENQIKEKINSLPKEIVPKIELIGSVPYEKLCDYFEKTHLNIGMGTTVLDAANHGVPSIVVKSYTMRSISSGFFSEHPEMLAARSEVLKSSYEIINKVIQMTEDDYIELCVKEYNTLKENYNMNDFIEKLFLHNNTQRNKKINSKILLLHHLAIKINKSM